MLAAEAGVSLGAIQALYHRAPLSADAVSAVCQCLDLPLPRLFDLAPLQKLGRLLRDRRERAGLSRKDLGQLARLSDSTIKFLEKGLHAPRPETWQRLLGVAALELSARYLEDCAGLPQDASTPYPESPVVRLDPSLSAEMVREQMLLTEQLLLHQHGVERSPSGWRQVCWLCGARSAAVAHRVEDVHRLTLRHAVACLGQLAESLLNRYPVIHDWARIERRSLATPTARRLQQDRQRVAQERVYGCRGGADLGEMLAYVSAAPASPYRNGAAAGLVWALGLGPCPLRTTPEVFDEGAARRLLAAASEAGVNTTEPADFLQGVIDTVTWILAPYAAPPQEPSTLGGPASLL